MAKNVHKDQNSDSQSWQLKPNIILIKQVAQYLGVKYVIFF